MSEKTVIAKRVRLEQPAICDKQSNLGSDWVAEKVNDLVVFPDSGLARCAINNRTLVARFAWYDADPATQSEWEQGGSYVCPDCGQSFANAQGLGNHKATKHATHSTKR
jgi:hypothetical protein